MSFTAAEDSGGVLTDEKLARLRQAMVTDTKVATMTDNKQLSRDWKRRKSQSEEAAALHLHHMTQFLGMHEYETKGMSVVDAYKPRASVTSAVVGSDEDTESEKSEHSSGDSGVEDKAPHPLTVKHLMLR